MIKALKVPIAYFRKAEQTLMNLNALDRKRRWISLDGWIFFPLKKEIKSLNFYHEIISVDDAFFPIKTKTYPIKSLEKMYNIKLPKSISILGDIILINQVPEGEDLERIGNILAKNYAVRAVFYKEKETSTIFRIAKWKRIYGFGSPLTVHKEWRYHYVVNVNKAFFNPRMSSERLRVIKQVKSGEIVLDMFSGVGPFAIPISKISRAYAIDINPSAIGFLRINKLINRADVKEFLGDCRNVISKFEVLFDRIIMNYPEKSLEFLKYALRVLKDGGVLHIYSFEKGKDGKEALKKVVEKLQREISKFELLNVFSSRDVAPHKYMVVLDVKVKF